MPRAQSKTQYLIKSNVGRFGRMCCIRHELHLRHTELSLLEIGISRNSLLPYYESRGLIRHWIFTQQFDKIKEKAPLFWSIHHDLFANPRLVIEQPPTPEPTMAEIQAERKAAFHARLTARTDTLLGRSQRYWNPSPYRHDARNDPNGTARASSSGDSHSLGCPNRKPEKLVHLMPNIIRKH